MMDVDASMGIHGGNTSSGLKFVHITDPSDSHSKGFRKQVRSHVTTQQHNRQRQKYLAQRERILQKTTKFQSFENKNANGKPEPKDEDEVASKTDADSASSAQGLPDSIFSKTLSRTTSNALEKAFSQGTMAFRTFALDDLGNTVGLSFKHLYTDASSVLKLYDYIVHVQAGDIQTQYSTGTPRSAAHQRFMGFIFQDPITLTMAMLIGVRCLLENCGSTTISSIQQNQLLHLKDFLIRSINIALNDDRRSVSDHMLICISLLASYEVKHENPESSNYHLHMRGLLEMIKMRGGLRAIGQQTPWVERVLIWNDANSAKIAGCDPYCSMLENASTYSKRPQANAEVFRTGKQKG